MSAKALKAYMVADGLTAGSGLSCPLRDLVTEFMKNLPPQQIHVFADKFYLH